MSARIAALMTAGALLAAAQPALADDHLPAIETEAVWMDERGAWNQASSERAAPISIAQTADLPRAPAGYRWVRASDLYSRSAAPRYSYNEAEREAWLADCTIMLSEQRFDYDDYYNDNTDGGLIGGLIGAVFGGFAGNRIADGDRLLGTLIGGGIGGIAGAVIGSVIDNSDDEQDYAGYEADPYAAQYCSAYLRRYEAQGFGAIAAHGSYGPATAYSASDAPERVLRRRNCGPCQEEVLVEEPTAARAIPPRRIAEPAPEAAPTKLMPIK